MSQFIDKILANPGRTLGIVGAIILAVLQTLVGQGVLAPELSQSVQNVGAILVVLIATFFPAWAPVQAMAARHR